MSQQPNKNAFLAAIEKHRAAGMPLTRASSLAAKEQPAARLQLLQDANPSPEQLAAVCKGASDDFIHVAQERHWSIDHAVKVHQAMQTGRINLAQARAGRIA